MKQPCAVGVAVVASMAAVAADVDARAKAIVDAMTVGQLLGQMTQIDLSAANTAAKVDEFAQLNVGSYFNFIGMGWKGNRVTANTEEWRAKLTEMQDIHMKRNKVPMMFGIDSVHGATYVDGSVLFPQSINTAAAFNPTLAEGLGKYMARDTKAAGIPWMFGPTLDVTRHKHWPRVYETFGEDPTVVAQMGKAVIESIQKQRVAACFKHFISYSDPTTGLDRDNSELSSYEILNYFMPPFKAAVEADVWSGMGTFVALNNVPLAANELMHKGLLRGDLGFKGLMVTDFKEIKMLVTQHSYAPTVLEAVYASLSKATYDMSMVPDDGSFIETGKQLVAQNRIPESRLRESVLRIVKLKLKLNLFDEPVPGADVLSQLGDEASQLSALAIARESMVLLKNQDNALPLTPGKASIFLTGSSSDSIGLLCGGWTLWWQGTSLSQVFPLGASVRKAMETTLGGADKFSFYQGFDTDGNLVDNDGKPGDLEAAKAMAAKADYTVVVLGERPYAEYKGNDDKQPLPPGFLTYVKALKSTGTKIILVLVEGRPRLLNGIADLAHAVIFAGLPCEYGGQAIVDVLLGKVNPSGRMAMTYPKTDTSINLATPYYKRTNTSCLKDGIKYECPAEWQFGDGLSYTSFHYSNATISTTALSFSSTGSNAFTVSVTVQNTGLVKGQETVLLFGTPPATRIHAETKLLKRFTKLSLAAGEANVVTFSLSHQDLGYYSNDIGKGLKKDAPSGAYTFFLKHDTDCSTSTPLCMTLKWDNPDKASFMPNATVAPTVVAPVGPSGPIKNGSTTVAPGSAPSDNDSASAGDDNQTVPVPMIVGISSGVVCACGILAFLVSRRKAQQQKPLRTLHVMESKEDRVVIVDGGGSLTYKSL
ncbi:hypothetical protein DYB32_004480 [Aphanomyces invadans]|uniref:beta-glucosidase n=1 Tax=Aphanomyces invadans TaxID=157072 RepID=A0A3R6YZJ4_9STRA|nr:hypothetical protein DYB32_004480 [Aphanomyces invadans]